MNLILIYKIINKMKNIYNPSIVIEIKIYLIYDTLLVTCTQLLTALEN